MIDATIEKKGDDYLMFLKDETLLPEVERNIRMTTSDDLYEGWAPVSEALTGHYTEGPTATRINGEWIVYFDRYREGSMGAIVSEDLENWTDISDSIQFPKGTRHGTVLKVKQSVVDRLKEE